MIPFRSRNIPNNYNTFDTKNSFNSNTVKIEEQFHVKSQILTNLTEYAGEARIIIQKNNSLKQIIALLIKNNSHTKNFINKIMTINKDIKSNNKKNNNSNNSNINNLLKDNMFHFVEEYNDFIRKNNNILNEKIQKIIEKQENFKKDLENEIEGLNKNLEEIKNMNFMLENRNKYKENIIRDLFQSYQNMGFIQENKRYRFINDELSQSDIDKYYSKFLAVFQQCLLNTTQNWNKYKNKAKKFEEDIEHFKNLLENPEKIIEKKDNNEIEEEQATITENDLLLMSFDEFEDESEATLESLILDTNEDNKDDNINFITSNNNENIIKINNIGKFNNNSKYNRINKMKNLSVNNRRINRIAFIKRDIYYMPQKDFSKSLIRNSESLNKIKPKEFMTFSPPTVNKKNITRAVSIDKISKLNLKQIVFNKKNKFIKEEAKEMAIRRFEIEKEYKMNVPKFDDPNDIKIKMEIKELKKDIKKFKEKKKKKKKLIKEFRKFCKDFLQKYAILINNYNIKNSNIICNNNNNFIYSFNNLNNKSKIKKK
jgi:hypothetical protein